MSNVNWLAIAVAPVLALSLLACVEDDDDGGFAEPIIGDWQTEDKAECAGIGNFNDYDVLEVEDDLEGTLVLHFVTWNYFYDDIECCVAEFDVEVEVDQHGEEYTIEADCNEEDAIELDCNDLDIELECELDGDDQLECEISGSIEGTLELEKD